jgi:hypothetical protein
VDNSGPSTITVVFAAIGFLASIITLIWLVWVVVGALIRKPKIDLQFWAEFNGSGDKVLMCEVGNLPIFFGPLAWLNIKRADVDEFFCLVHVFRADNMTAFASSLLPTLHDRKGNHIEHVSPLRASSFGGVKFGVALMNRPGIASLLRGEVPPLSLPPDTYTCRIVLHGDESHIKVSEHDFVVGVSQEGFSWIGQIRNLRTSLLGRFRDKFLVRQAGRRD